MKVRASEQQKGNKTNGVVCFLGQRQFRLHLLWLREHSVPLCLHPNTVKVSGNVGYLVASKKKSFGSAKLFFIIIIIKKTFFFLFF